MTSFRLIVVGLATVAPVIAASFVASAQTTAAPVAPVAVKVTASACEPDDLSVAAGRVTFAIRNDSARALEWEILDGVMVVYERENIPPGQTRNLTAKLEPGDYDVTCGLMSNPKGRLHVAALAGAAAKPSQIDLIGPLAEYRVYASYEIDALAEESKRLADAIGAGDLAAARALYPLAHAHYARLAPIAVFFPDLDGAVDSPADGPDKDADPALIGFRQLEWDLFAEAERRDCRAVADKLVADVQALQGRFENLSLTPAPTIAGAIEAIGGLALGGIGGETDRANRIGLSDLAANIEGVKKIIDLFLPLIEKGDKPLGRLLGDDFSTIETTLARYRSADGAYPASADLSVGDRAILQNVTKKLAGELAQVRGPLGLS